jgi:chromosome segregation ATPase
LQRKLATLEDSLEDARAISEREETAVRERVKRFKEKEDAMRSELNEGRKTVEQVLKAEALAKGRVEEVEEALRESTLALKNAQAEIENLRSDVAVSNSFETPS